MLPISTKDQVPFTPESAKDLNPAPVYYLKVADMRERANFERALQLNRVREVYAFEIIDALKRAIPRVYPEDKQQEKLALVDAISSRETQPVETMHAFNLMDRFIEINDEDYLMLSADRRYFNAMFPIIATQMFLVGGENIGAEIKRVGDKISNETLNRIPAEHVNEIGHKLRKLIYLDPDAEKNSPSPSPSPSTALAETSTADATAPSTVAGTSMEPST